MTSTLRHSSRALCAVGCICLSLLAAPGFAKPVRDPRDPKLKSSSVLVIDESDSSVLYARHSDVPMPIASITKLMTSLVVLDAGQPLDEQIRITDADCEHGRGGFSRLAVGTVLTRAT